MLLPSSGLSLNILSILMHYKICFWGLVGLLGIVSCSTPSSQEQIAHDSTEVSSLAGASALDYFTSQGDSLIIPPFEIEVELSVRANTKMTVDKETIIVSATFMGIPNDTSSEASRQDGEITLRQHAVELTASRVARFENLKLSKKAYNSLANKDIRLLINVFSGRKKTRDNVLDCGIFEAKMSEIINKRSTIQCSLIEGED
jgi:hypothetical protein